VFSLIAGAFALRADAKSKDEDQAAALIPKSAKALTGEVNKGLEFLVKTQLESGAWGQGDEAATMGDGMANLRKVPNVADTSMAALALLRADGTPAGGAHAKSIARAIDFICASIEKSDDKSLYVTDVRNTRTQGKLGPYVDTFAASMILSEVKGRMGGDNANGRVEKALNKVLAKIEANQRSDGTWDSAGWAPALSQAMASKGLNQAAKAGSVVPQGTRKKAEEYASKQFDQRSNSFGGDGSAGVGLYAGASSVSSLEASVEANDAESKDLEKLVADPKTPPKMREEANKRLDGFKATKKVAADAEQALEGRLKDPQFVSGFGSNGGEEFLSYMLVSESLAAKGGKEWDNWDKSMTSNLVRVQNTDGSWTGHHCITGRTFVTAAALLVLTADRAPGPVAGKLRHG
jgi:hypothetical protein